MELEWLILADFAQVINGKVYVQGGGWTALTVNKEFPIRQRVGIAASFIVPWPETNQQHSVEIEVQTDDGKQIAKIDGAFEVGRPAGIPVGQDQRAQLAGNLTLELNPGTYALVGRVEGQEAGRTHFNVVPGPMQAMKLQQQQQRQQHEGDDGDGEASET